MANNKVLFFFNDGAFGWSESYYDSVTSNDIYATMNKALVLAPLRSACLAGGAAACTNAPCSTPQLVGIRVSQVGNPRNTVFATPNGVLATNTNGQLTWTVPTNNGAGTQNAALGAPDNPYSAVAMIYFLPDGQQSKRSLSGCPDLDICDQAFNPDSAWLNAFKAFGQGLITGQWGALSQYPRSNKLAGTPQQMISQLGAPAPLSLPPQDGFGRPYITLNAAIPLPTPGVPLSCYNTKLVVWGYLPNTGTPNINGVYRAIPQGISLTNLSTATFLLKRKFSTLSYLCLGYAALVAPTVLPFVNIMLGRPTKRDRGRPFGLRAGRARAHR